MEAVTRHPHAASDRRVLARRAGDRAPDISRPVVADTTGMRVSWGGVWAGVIVGLGTLFLLTALGLAVGLSVVQPGETDAGSAGLGAGIWAGASLLVALFTGGLVSTRVGMVHDKATGFFEGALVWVLSVLLIGWLATSGIGLLANSAFQVVGGATRAIGSAVGTANLDFSTGTVDDIVQRLRDPQTAQTIATVTGLPIADVRSQLTETAARVESVRSDPARAAAEARRSVQDMIARPSAEGRFAAAAERVQSGATRTAWATLAALVLSLVAAVAGAFIGRRRAAVRAGVA